MFFKKKKPKIDPKIRFQNRQFNQKLQQARTFKRTAKPIPVGRFSKFLVSVGLGRPLRQIIFAIVVLGVSYLVYFPNFLTLQKIEIEGLINEDKSVVEALIRDDIAKVPFYNPQRNLFFLNKERVTRLLQNYPLIKSVEKIDKQYKQQTLKISVLPKHDTFLVRSDNKLFTIYNDGVLKGEMDFDQAKWETPANSRLVKVDILAKINNGNSKFFLAGLTANYIRELTEALKVISGSKLSYFKIPLSQQIASVKSPETTIVENNEAESSDPAELTSQQPTEPIIEQPLPPLAEVNTPIVLEELNIIMTKGDNKDRVFTVLIDPKESTKQLVERLRLLLSQTSVERYEKLDYIDLRVSDRAYICLKQTVCSK